MNSIRKTAKQLLQHDLWSLFVVITNFSKEKIKGIDTVKTGSRVLPTTPPGVMIFQGGFRHEYAYKNQCIQPHRPKAPGQQPI